MAEEAHWFESGGHRLFGILHRSDGDAGTVLVLHGFTGSHIGSKYYFVDLARSLCEEGFDVFRFDYAGSGNSEGEFRVQDLESTVRDAENALDYLKEEGVSTEPLGLVGHSKGGSTAILLAGERDVDSLVTWATVARYRDLWAEEEIELARDQDTVEVYGFEWATDGAFESFEYDFPSLVADLDIPTLFIHGKKDESAPPSHSEELYEAASEPREHLELPESDHIFTDASERKELIDRTVEWFKYTL